MPPMKRKQDVQNLNEEQKKSKVELSETVTQQRLKIEELLKEIKPSEKRSDAIDEFVEKLKAELCAIKGKRVEHKLCDSSWLKKVKLPIDVVNLSSIKGTFRFQPIKHVHTVGSFSLGTFNRRHGCVDLAVEMPQECFQEKDHLNTRYFVKRAYFLAHVAAALCRQSDVVQTVSFTFHDGNRMKPLLLLKPKGDDLRHVTFVLHVFPGGKAFKLNRFHITKNNIRSSWYSPDRSHGKVEDAATPHYNSWILSDVTLLAQNNHLVEALGSNQSVKDGVALLKIWLHQRQLDQGFGCFSGFLMSMFVAFLLTQRKINASMTAYQLFRKTLVEFAQQDWCSSGVTMATDTSSSPEAENRPNLSDFHAAFDIVFVDFTGYLNLCANMSAATYQLVKHEAGLAVQYLEQSNAFESLFLVPVTFQRRYDQTFSLAPAKTLQSSTIELLKLDAVVMDYCGDYVNACVPPLTQLLRRSLGQRVVLIASKPAASLTWDVTAAAPSVDSVESLSFGLLLDPQQAIVTHDLGPFGGSPEAEEFRALWKEKSELRRFPDGSIREAVVWPAETLAEKRMICSQIVKHILVSHAGFRKLNVHFTCNQFDAVLCPSVHLQQPTNGTEKPAAAAAKIIGTGEEHHSSIVASCDSLGKLLHAAVSAADDLPLAINSVSGTAPAFRYSEVFPAVPVKTTCSLERRECRLVPSLKPGSRCPVFTQPMTVVCMLEGSGKWPEDLEAVRRLKAAYYMSLSRALSKVDRNMLTAAYTDHLDVYKDGYVFRVVIGSMHEILLHKSQLVPDGPTKSSSSEDAGALEYQLVTLPRLTSLIHGLHQQWNSFSGTVRLAKRWLSAQMLLCDHFEEETVELLVASLYVDPAPFTVPGTPLVGFLRFLCLMSTHDWLRDPLIVNINNELTEIDIAEIRAKFSKERSTLPLMYIATPLDRLSQLYTRKKPSPPLLQRAVLLARESLSVLEQLLEQRVGKAQFKQIFRPPTSGFDVTIELNRKQLAHEHCAVDVPPYGVPHCIPYSKPKSGDRDVWPVVGYDPAQLYLAELRAAFDDVALFFYDKYGGTSIGVIWKPSAVHPQPFKMSHINCRMPQPGVDGQEVQLVLNRDAVLEDFRVMGSGLVEDIVVKST